MKGTRGEYEVSEPPAAGLTLTSVKQFQDSYRILAGSIEVSVLRRISACWDDYQLPRSQDSWDG